VGVRFRGKKCGSFGFGFGIFPGVEGFWFLVLNRVLQHWRKSSERVEAAFAFDGFLCRVSDGQSIDKSATVSSRIGHAALVCKSRVAMDLKLYSTSLRCSSEALKPLQILRPHIWIGGGPCQPPNNYPSSMFTQ
jgi:hypothetical protein